MFKSHDIIPKQIIMFFILNSQNHLVGVLKSSDSQRDAEMKAKMNMQFPYAHMCIFVLVLKQGHMGISASRVKVGE